MIKLLIYIKQREWWTAMNVNMQLQLNRSCNYSCSDSACGKHHMNQRPDLGWTHIWPLKMTELLESSTTEPSSFMAMLLMLSTRPRLIWMMKLS